MTALTREHLIERRAKAVKAHAPRAHIDRDLVRLTAEQIIAETRGHWQLGPMIVNAAIGLALAAIVIVLGVVR